MKPFWNVVRLYHGPRSALADPTVKGRVTLTFTLVTVASPPFTQPWRVGACWMRLTLPW